VRDPLLPGAGQRAEAGRLYGADPVGYDQGRPDYPERVYEVLRTRCALGAGSAAVEIGPGTGRVTRRLTALGATVVAVEPDPALADHLEQAVAGTRTAVVRGTFEEVVLPEGAFDLAVAAMSFHWVDQDVGLPKLGRVLRRGGWAALWWTRFGDPARPDPFHEATRHLFEHVGDPLLAERPPFELDAAGWEHALSRGAGLVDVRADLVPWTARLTVADVRALYASMIAVRRRRAPERRALLDELAARAVNDFGGMVERPFVTALYTARRP
jgi:SAM-dependent methyltransferase